MFVVGVISANLLILLYEDVLQCMRAEKQGSGRILMDYCYCKEIDDVFDFNLLLCRIFRKARWFGTKSWHN